MEGPIHMCLRVGAYSSCSCNPMSPCMGIPAHWRDVPASLGQRRSHSLLLQGWAVLTLKVSLRRRTRCAQINLF